MKLDWGVYKADCYKLSAEDKEKLFLQAFCDYKDALRFAAEYSDGAAIHLIGR